MLEKDVEAYFRKTVERMGGATWKFVSPTNRGVADRIALLPNGEVWFVEIKRPGGKLTELQKLFAAKVNGLGGNYACLWSKDDVNEWADQCS